MPFFLTIKLLGGVIKPIYIYMNDDVLGHLREARAILNDETKSGKGSRESSLVITKIDEALMWRERDLSQKMPIVNEVSN
jgi:hypothetical protein